MRVDESPMEWAKATFGAADLGDPRRTKRLVTLASDKAEKVGSSIPEICKSSAAQEGAYRLLRNDSVEPEAIIDAGCEYTASLAKDYPGVLLSLQDTTTLSYGHDVEGAGPLGGPQNSGRGVWVHTTLLVAADVPQVVGIIEQRSWVRSFETTRARRKQRPYEEKESYRWEQTDVSTCERLGAELAARTILVADREAESVELLGYLLEHGRRFVLRSRTNRALLNEGDKLHTPGRYELLGDKQVPLQQRGNPHGRSARKTTVEVRAGTAQLRTESTRFPGVQEVSVVHVLETTPEPEASPLEWWLLTTEPVETLEQAWKCVEYYRQRWLIEDFHKAWKSGTQVEELQFRHVDNIRRYAAILAFIAVRLLQLRELAYQFPAASAEAYFSPIQWKVLWLTEQKLWKKTKRRKPPGTAPTMQWAHMTLAKLGGFKDSKRTGRPGWDPLWDGYLDLEARVEGFKLALEAMGADF